MRQPVQLSLKVHELRARVQELERALGSTREQLTAERARSAHLEDALKRAYRCELRIPSGRQPVPMRSCQHCGTRYQPIRKDQKFCRSTCKVNSWQRLHPRRRGAPSGPTANDRGR